MSEPKRRRQEYPITAIRSKFSVQCVQETFVCPNELKIHVTRGTSRQKFIQKYSKRYKDLSIVINYCNPYRCSLSNKQDTFYDTGKL